MKLRKKTTFLSFFFFTKLGYRIGWTSNFFFCLVWKKTALLHKSMKNELNNPILILILIQIVAVPSILLPTFSTSGGFLTSTSVVNWLEDQTEQCIYQSVCSLGRDLAQTSQEHGVDTVTSRNHWLIWLICLVHSLSSSTSSLPLSLQQKKNSKSAVHSFEAPALEFRLDLVTRGPWDTFYCGLCLLSFHNVGISAFTFYHVLLFFINTIFEDISKRFLTSHGRWDDSVRNVLMTFTFFIPLNVQLLYRLLPGDGADDPTIGLSIPFMMCLTSACHKYI